MERRKFITGVGSATATGLAGCIDMVSSNEDPNGDENNTDDNTDTTPSSSEYDLKTFTTSKSCASDNVSEFSSITDPEDTSESYEFSGRTIIPNTCHELKPDVTILDGDLIIEMTAEKVDPECDENCVTMVNFAGSLTVSDEIDIETSQIQI